MAAIENDGHDEFYAYFNLYRMFTQTAGIGSLERRDYIMHPPEAKKEAEIYDKIMAWEREIK